MQDCQAIWKTQQEFFATGETRPLSFRLEQLSKLKNILLHHQTEILHALQRDLHKCETEALFTEFLLVIREIDFV